MVPPAGPFGVPIWAAVYAVSAAAFCVSGLVFYLRVIRPVLVGQEAGRLDRPLRRLVGALPLTLGQRKVLQSVSLLRDRAGLGHFVIFWGFLSFVASYLLFIFGDVISPEFSASLLTERGVEIVTAYLDILAVGFLFILGWAAVRRWAVRPSRLRFDLTQKPESAVILLLIAFLMALTLLTEAFYTVSGGSGPHAEAPVGAALGDLLEGLGLGSGAASGLHTAAWWAHLLVILGFSVYIPLSKHMHIVASPLSFLMRSLEPRGTLSTPDLETAESFGASKAAEFTQKELLDGFACAVCGRCTDSCPANLTEKVLSPMHIVENLKEHVLESGPEPRPLIGGWVQEEALWDCLTCGACVQECPVGVEHIDTIVDMRRHLVMERAEMPDTAANALMSLEQRGHPWRGTTYTRTDWADGLGVPTLEEKPDADVLFWVGCTAALEQRSQSVARAMVSVLKRAGVDFAILGAEEGCTGDPARRMGNEYLYQILARQNIETLDRYGVKRIVTICPHCFNSMRNEYPHLGGHYEVMHYSELVAELVREGRIRPLVEIESTVAYHDSCYLGRHNGIYDAPREIAESVPGLKLVEAERRRERGFCCGAGGGHMWMEESRGQRVNHARAEQLLETGADTVGVSCPFCLQMFEEALSSKGIQGEKRARDLLEVLAESLGDDPDPPSDQPQRTQG